jgi:DNA-binding response OmpR family regulator
MKILLIEPNRNLAATYRQALERAGHTVDWQQAAQAAVSSADGKRPDAIILELQLAAHSGIEFLYEFRSYADWQTIPVIVHSFVPKENLMLQREQLQAFGIANVLYKPTTSLKQLLRAVNELPVVTT